MSARAVNIFAPTNQQETLQEPCYLGFLVCYRHPTNMATVQGISKMYRCANKHNNVVR